MKKPELQVNVTKCTQEEIILLVKAECDDFNYIPEHEQWVMALYALGQSEDFIAAFTGRTSGQVKHAVHQYATLTSTLPDNVKMSIHHRMAFNSIGTYWAVLTNKKKIEELSPRGAADVLEKLFDLMREYMKLEAEYVEHQNKMKSMTFKGFEKVLGEGK